MITIVFCLRRLPGLSREEFQHYGLAGHAPLAREHAAVLGIRRYVQSHSPIERLRPVWRLDAQHALPPAHRAWRSSHPCPIDAKRRCIEARR
ncbi:EthD domain-containing protein [Blastomonas sp.]|uniref:EthD domain-containing protein n=1 Tax=Blastomonas sp. TaxID=1909299 RepID=UPI00406A612B